jgi:hypothetical protein
MSASGLLGRRVAAKRAGMTITGSDMGAPFAEIARGVKK